VPDVPGTRAIIAIGHDMNYLEVSGKQLFQRTLAYAV
jgi:hypothetical protein